MSDSDEKNRRDLIGSGRAGSCWTGMVAGVTGGLVKMRDVGTSGAFGEEKAVEHLGHRQKEVALNRLGKDFWQSRHLL